MPPTRVRACLHPALQPPTTFEEPRRPGGTSQEQAIPLQHLWEGFCY